MRRLLVNDTLSALPDHKTFWHDLQPWFDMVFVGAPFDQLVSHLDAQEWAEPPDSLSTLIVRNASWFGPLESSKTIPTISLLQDIFTEGPLREMQRAVMRSSRSVVFNSQFTMSKTEWSENTLDRVIPLPVDFTLFEPGNPMGLQQALSLPDNCICWIGSQHEIKGFDILLTIVRQNPDLNFVAVFKDAQPEYGPPNLRMFTRLTHAELVKVIGACRVGLCTSRMESQHLAGIEMGACGLPMVAPQVGTYWKREDMPGVLIGDLKANCLPYVSAIRVALKDPGDPQQTRDYWRKDFDKPVIKAAWSALIKEVEQ